MPLVRRLIIVGTAFALTGCEVTDPPGGVIIPKPQTVFVSFSGTLKQTVFVEHPANAQDEKPVLSISSIVENTGALGQMITTRICQPLPEDLSADGLAFVPLDPECEENEASFELKGGEKTEQIMGRFELVGDPGVYKIRVRQLLKPNSGTEIETRIP